MAYCLMRLRELMEQLSPDESFIGKAFQTKIDDLSRKVSEVEDKKPIEAEAHDVNVTY